MTTNNRDNINGDKDDNHREDDKDDGDKDEDDRDNEEDEEDDRDDKEDDGDDDRAPHPIADNNNVVSSLLSAPALNGAHNCGSLRCRSCL